MKSHLDAVLQQDLDHIRTKVTEMGSLATKAIEASVRAVVERNRQLAFAVILRDQYVDEMEKQLDRLCLEFLVRHQPAASILRFAYAAIKVNLELERVGDYAESIAREALRLERLDAPLPVESLDQLAGLAIPMLRDSIDAFVKQDPDLARRTIEKDEAVDLLRDKVKRDLQQSYVDGNLPFEALLPMIEATRRLERVSDQARNVSMETLYMCTGEYAKHPGSEAMRVLFVDEHNACRSLIAEAIGIGMRESGFIFSSAGMEPAPVDPRTIEFMESKGFDISRSVPKSLLQVPNLDHQHVIVLLAPEARRAFPRRPRKAVLLEWTVDDPYAGDETKLTERFEEIYGYVEGQIRDLISAIQNSSSV